LASDKESTKKGWLDNMYEDYMDMDMTKHEPEDEERMRLSL